MRESEFNRFDGGIPSAGPLAARLDFNCSLTLYQNGVSLMRRELTKWERNHT
jgi:hypothetical protein